jgi:predicted TPR repeat methyltransferase
LVGLLQPYLTDRSGALLDIGGGGSSDSTLFFEFVDHVTVVDVSDVGLQQAKERADAAGVSLVTVEADLEGFPDALPRGPYRYIGNANFLSKALIPTMINRLEPGGLLAMIVATLTNLERNKHPSARFLVAPDELPQLLFENQEGLELLHHSEEWRENGRHEAHCVIKRTGQVEEPASSI